MTSYLESMRQVAPLVEFEILRTAPGQPFFGSQLRVYAGESTIAAVLDRMQALGLVSRLASGLYVRPLKDERGEECLPATEAVLEAVRRADQCSLWPRAAVTAGAAAGELSYWSTGRSRTLRLQNLTLKLTHSCVDNPGPQTERVLAA